MKYLFRLNCSASIGSGHLRRSGVIANKFMAAGDECYCVAQKFSGEMIEDAKSFFTELIKINSTEAEVVRMLQSWDLKFDAVIFDDYTLRASEHILYRSIADLLVAIDDCPVRTMDVDIIFDANFSNDIAYNAINSRQVKVFSGPKAQIVDPAYLEKPYLVNNKITGQNSSCYFSLGGFDRRDLTKKLIDVIQKHFPSTMICIANTFGTMDYLRSIDNIHLLSSKSDLIDACYNCDFGIGAAGTMTWERNCGNLPTFHLIIAENQRQVAYDMYKMVGTPFFDAVKRPIEELDVLLYNFIIDKNKQKQIKKKLENLERPTGVNFIPEFVKFYKNRS